MSLASFSDGVISTVKAALVILNLLAGLGLIVRRTVAEHRDTAAEFLLPLR